MYKKHWRWYMSAKYPILPPKKVIKAMKQLGFQKISQKSSHIKYMNNTTGKIFIIPKHYEVARGTLRSILEQANIELEEFLKNL